PFSSSSRTMDMLRGSGEDRAAPPSRCDLDMIDDVGDAGCGPGRIFGQAPLEPGMHLAVQDDLSAVGLDRDVRGVERGAAAQRLLDLVFDLERLGGRGHADQVDDLDDTAEVVNGLIRFFPLVTRLDLAAERDDAPLDFDVDPVRGNADAPSQDVDRPLRDLVVGNLLVGWQANLDLLGDRSDATDPPCGALRGNLLRVARHIAAEGNHTGMDADADIGRVDAGLEVKLVEHVMAYLVIALHIRPPELTDRFCGTAAGAALIHVNPRSAPAFGTAPAPGGPANRPPKASLFRAAPWRRAPAGRAGPAARRWPAARRGRRACVPHNRFPARSLPNSCARTSRAAGRLAETASVDGHRRRRRATAPCRIAPPRFAPSRKPWPGRRRRRSIPCRR